MLRKATLMSALLLSALSGCAYTVKDHQRGHTLGSVRGTEHAHQLEQIILDGEAHNVQKGLDLGPETIDIVLYPNSTTSRTIDPATKTITLNSPKAYIPFRQDASNGEPMSYVRLNPEGPNGIRAHSRKVDVSKTPVGTVTVPGSSYHLKTLTINGVAYHAPDVEPGARSTDGEELNIYLIPVEGTQYKISPKGTITLVNTEKGIFRPEKVFEDTLRKGKTGEVIETGSD